MAAVAAQWRSVEKILWDPRLWETPLSRTKTKREILMGMNDFGKKGTKFWNLHKLFPKQVKQTNGYKQKFSKNVSISKTRHSLS